MSTEKVEEKRGPTWDDLKVKLMQVAEQKGEWAGLPMPLFNSDHQLMTEPRYPFPMKVDDSKSIDETAPDIETINTWHSDRLNTTVGIERINGKLKFSVFGYNRVKIMLGTLEAAACWRPAAESQAQRKLMELLNETQFNSFYCTGTFLERSKRSGCYYMFRRGRPTVVLNPDASRVLCCLCLHPIGLYRGTWAGALTPSDEVIAHLVLMRGDEHAFWKWSNQHHPVSHAGGL